MTGEVVCRTRPLCYKGSFTNAKIHVMMGHDVEENVIPDCTQTYLVKKKLRELSETKLDHLRQMSRSFIPIDRHFSFL